MFSSLISPLFLSTVLSSGAAWSAPLVAPGINSSRVVPGASVTTDEVAEKLSGVKVISMGAMDGPQTDLFVQSALRSLNRERQGQYRTAADVGASAVGGLGQLGAAATGVVAAGSGIVGAGLVAKKAEGAVEGGTERAAAQLDGVDRHPAEGFGIRVEGATTAERIHAGAEKVVERSGALDGAAKVAGAVGAAQVETALGLGKDAAKVTSAFFRAGVEGNSRPFKGVKLPIEAVEDGRGDAELRARVVQKQLPDKKYVKKEKRKKKDANGKVVRDAEGKIVYEVVEIPCIKRTVEVDITSRLVRADGTVITKSSHSGTETDDACGPKRMKLIKSADELAAPHISSAGGVWGRLIQPQMDTIRLKFNPSGSTALAIDHILKNRHAAGMCLLQEAGEADGSDAFVHYNRAVLLEAWGRYADALPLYQQAETDPAFSKGRWDNGARRASGRLEELERMAVAYDMVARETAFPYAETCPTIDRSDRTPISKRVDLLTAAKGDPLRRLYEGELVRVVATEGKFVQVEQLDGSTGWVKAKRAFK